MGCSNVQGGNGAGHGNKTGHTDGARGCGSSAGDSAAGSGITPEQMAQIVEAIHKILGDSGKPSVPPMGEAAVLKKEKELMPKNRGEMKDKMAEIDKIIADPKSAPDLVQALKGMRSVMTGGIPRLNADQTKDLDVLKAHPEIFPVTTKNIQQKIDDPQTPPEVKKALTRIKDDPTFSLMLDTGKRGGGAKKADGKIGFDDVKTMSRLQDQMPEDVPFASWDKDSTAQAIEAAAAA